MAVLGVDPRRRGRASSRRRPAPGQAGSGWPARRRGHVDRSPADARRRSGAPWSSASSQLVPRVGVGDDPAAGAEPDGAVARSSRVRMATFSSSPATRAGEADRAGVDLARRCPRARRSRCSAWTFGAPVTEPGGNVARSSVGVADARAQPARDARDEVPQARVRLGRRARAARRTDPYSHTRPRSLRIRSTIITCSAASLAEARAASAAARRVVGAARVPLIGAVHDLAAAAAQEQLGREAGDAAVRRVEAAAVGGPQRAQRAAANSVERGRRRSRASQPQAEVGLEDLAGGDPLAARRRPRRSGRRRRGAARSGERVRHGAGAARRASARAAAPARVERASRARGGCQRLEPPAPVGVAGAARGRSRRGGTSGTRRAAAAPAARARRARRAR